MTTDASLKILVIILSATLALFLILSIVAVIKVIQVFSSLRDITKKAELIADKAEAVTDFFEKSAAPLALTRFLTNVADVVSKHKHSR
ncbi:MAG: hypothetical protein ABI221_01310 [Candidatus Saccharimonadales bacterium]